MQDKIKFALIGLAAAIIIMLFLLLQSGQYAGKLKTEKSNLEETNNSLNSQLSRLQKENNQIKEEFIAARRIFEQVEAEKATAETTFKSLVEERDRLRSDLEQLRAKLTAAQAAPAEKSEVKKGFEESVSPSADAYWAGVLKKKAELELTIEGLSRELKSAKLENEQLKRDKTQLGLDLQAYDSDQKDAHRVFEYNKKLADNLTTDLAREKTDKFQMAEILKSLKNENNSLKQQLKILFERKTKLEEQFSALQDKNSQLENSMVKMESFVREKILQADSLRSDLGIMSAAQGPGEVASGAGSTELSSRKRNAIELAPIVVRPQEEDDPQEQEEKAASVVAINQENNFVIVDAGLGSGVKKGDTFQVFRNDDPVAVLEVIQVREKISACDIKSENTPIAVGDTIR
jgi:DNA repair exonuclease SbcCD ATPase subunit